MNQETLLQSLASKGHKLSRTRRVVIELFVIQPTPLDYRQIAAYCKDHGLDVNKTTIYRELDFLVRERIIRELDFGEGKKRYELLRPGDHHHHLICNDCGDIQEAQLADNSCALEPRMLENHNFRVTNHMLEFFGQCINCQKG